MNNFKAVCVLPSPVKNWSKCREKKRTMCIRFAGYYTITYIGRRYNQFDVCSHIIMACNKSSLCINPPLTIIRKENNTINTTISIVISVISY